MTEPKDPKVKVTDKRGQQEPDDATQPEAETLAEERLDQLLRLKADFENYRKRVIREQTDLVERASLRIVEQLLPVLDNLQLTLDAALEAGNDSLVRGVEIVSKQLHDVLASEGLEHAVAEGTAFDPHEHEAVASFPGAVDQPTVLEVVRPGYKLKGKTIRPALVNVAVPDDQEGRA